MLANEMVNYNRRNMETYVLNRRNELLGGVLKNVESFETVEKRITSDRLMSDEGKRAKLAEEAWQKNRCRDTVPGAAMPVAPPSTAPVPPSRAGRSVY